MQFTYRAKQDTKTEASGVVEAIDLSAALAHLKRMGLFPVEVIPLELAKAVASSFRKNRPLSRNELSLWARTVAQGLKAGLSLTQSLHLLAEQEKGRVLGEVARVLEEKVTAGESLGGAMAELGLLFPVVAMSLVKAGEASGALEQVLQSFALQVEAEAELIAKVQGALIYPAFVFFLGVATVAVLMWVVVPKLGTLFTETGQQLPWMTQLMVSSGRGLVLGFVLAIICVAVGISFAGAQLRQRLAQLAIKAIGALPWFGRLMKDGEVARLSATLNLLIGNGLPLPESMRLAAATIGRLELKEKILRAERDVVEGSSLSAALRHVQVQEPFLLTLVAIGEAQGDLAGAFQQTGIRYHEEVDRGVKVISTLVEPVMILLVGLVVGGIVFSMLLPIFQLNFTAGG